MKNKKRVMTSAVIATTLLSSGLGLANFVENSQTDLQANQSNVIDTANVSLSTDLDTIRNYNGVDNAYTVTLSNGSEIRVYFQSDSPHVIIALTHTFPGGWRGTITKTAHETGTYLFEGLDDNDGYIAVNLELLSVEEEDGGFDDDGDDVTPPVTDPDEDDEIEVVSSYTETRDTVLEYSTTYVNDDTLLEGTQEVRQQGLNGLIQEEFSITMYVTGEVVEELISTDVVSEPIDEVIHVGTMIEEEVETPVEEDEDDTEEEEVETPVEEDEDDTEEEEEVETPVEEDEDDTEEEEEETPVEEDEDDTEEEEEVETPVEEDEDDTEEEVETPVEEDEDDTEEEEETPVEEDEDDTEEEEEGVETPIEEDEDDTEEEAPVEDEKEESTPTTPTKPVEDDKEETTPTTPTERKTHVVRYGENLSRIARQYGVTVQQLVQWNNISNPNLILTGQRLFVSAPTSTTTPTAPTERKTHTVRFGENLTRIARQYNVTVGQLVQWNNISNPNRIITGQRLFVSQGGSNNQGSNGQGNQAQGVSHLVRSGENLTRIARQYGVTVRQLVQLNNLSNPNFIRTGQRLTISQGNNGQRGNSVASNNTTESFKVGNFIIDLPLA